MVKPALLCVPAIAMLVLIAGYPLARTFQYSLTDATLGNLDSPASIGLENFSYLMRDAAWWQSVWNTALFTSVSVALETGLGLGVALLLDSKIRLKGTLRAAVLVPWAIPAVVSARLWAWIFNDSYGVLNETLRRFGIGSGSVAWLGDERLSLAVLVAVDVWKTTPFMALMILAGLQTIPVSLKEAARVDGASAWQEFWKVTLPLVQPALRVAILFRFLDALRVFDLPFVLTSNSRSTAVVSIFARQQMVDFQEVGYGSAASVVIFCATASIAAIYLLTAQRQLGLARENVGGRP